MQQVTTAEKEERNHLRGTTKRVDRLLDNKIKKLLDEAGIETKQIKEKQQSNEEGQLSTKTK